MTRAPAVLAVAMLLVIAFGLGNVLYKNLKVAPEAAHGIDGRLHYQLKNVTRLAGGAEEVRRAVQRAVTLEDSAAASPGDWRSKILNATGQARRPGHVVAIGGEGDHALPWALPGAFWAAYAGVPVVFLGKGSAGAEALAEVKRRGLPVYVLAPGKLVSGAVLAELAKVAPVRRIAGDTLSDHAVRIAEYRDPESGFGWGRTHERLDTYFQYVIAAPSDAEIALGALPLAPAVAGAFLFADDQGGLPGSTDRYVWSQRADWFMTPSETSFRHFWVVGDRVSYAAQARLDLAVEKAPYVSKGSAALGPMEAIGIVFIVFGIAGALFVYLHARRLLPEVMLTTRFAWMFTALLVPLGGVILYLAAYRRPRLNPGEDMPKWLRPPAIQAAAATAMGFGYGAPLMICIGYAFVYFGFPLAFGEWAADGAVYQLGTGMNLMMVGMYVFAVLIAWPLVQLPMKRMMHEASTRTVALSSLGVTAVSMAAVSLGMMSTSWWMTMRHIPMMPHEDEILWFFALWLASAVGFLVAWPLNWPMVRTQLKPGTM